MSDHRAGRVTRITNEDDFRCRRYRAENFIYTDRAVDFFRLEIPSIGQRSGGADIAVTVLCTNHLITGPSKSPDDAVDDFHRSRTTEDAFGIKAMNIADCRSQFRPLGIRVALGSCAGGLAGADRTWTCPKCAFILREGD